MRGILEGISERAAEDDSEEIPKRISGETPGRILEKLMLYQE